MRLFLMLAGLLAAAPALAQQAPVPATPPGRPGQPAATIIAEPVSLLIAAFDSDADARVTRAEFDAGLRGSWARNTGPSVSYIGYSDWAEAWLGDRNALPNPFEIDHDGDNRITFDELARRFDLFFTRFDTNKDGVIVRAELLTVHHPRIPRDRRGRPIVDGDE
jgi:hypothetical protein